MTEVAFHSGVSDKLGYTCRLLRKVWRQGLGAVVTGDSGDMARLDPMLWTFDPAEFIPHARARSGVSIAPELARTPIWLVDAGAAIPQSTAPAAQVLVNLGATVIADVARFERVVEIVSTDSADRQAARQRWRAYEQAGLRITHHPQDTARA
jgi:DNA polymerase III subunit chi